jgi:hypothetical protein
VEDIRVLELGYTAAKINNEEEIVDIFWRNKKSF